MSSNVAGKIPEVNRGLQLETSYKWWIFKSQVWFAESKIYHVPHDLVISLMISLICPIFLRQGQVVGAFNMFHRFFFTTIRCRILLDLRFVQGEWNHPEQPRTAWYSVVFVYEVIGEWACLFRKCWQHAMSNGNLIYMYFGIYNGRV